RGPAVTLPEPYMDPATIPEFRTVLERRLLSKVRIFEAWCENGDRLCQVLKIQRRPLAVARSRRDSVTLSANPALNLQHSLGHREHWQGMWLDLDWRAYYLPRDEESDVLRPIRLSTQCQHERLLIWGDWLRQQVLDGVRKYVITDATRLKAGQRY